MAALIVNQLLVEINGNEILKNVSFEIEKGNKVALIGANGIGKTTLFKAITKEIDSKQGTIDWRLPKDEISVVKQELSNENLTPREWVESCSPHLANLKNQLAYLLENWSDEDAYVNKYNELLQQYIELNGFEWEEAVERHLKLLQIPKNSWDVSISELSGGQKTRCKLGTAFFGSSSFLLLDEPTNHLDQDGIEWLANMLQHYKGTVLFISHDRFFINRVVTQIIELTEKGTKKYDGNYEFYMTQKVIERKTELAEYERYQSEKRKLKQSIANYRNWYQKANNKASVRDVYAQNKAAKAANRFKVKEKKLEQLESKKVEKPSEDMVLHTSFSQDNCRAKHFLVAESISFSYGEKKVIEDSTFSIDRSERYAIVGENGSGKTTFLRLLCGQLEPTKGTIKQNPSVKIGYFMQELEQLDEENTIVEEIMLLPHMTETDARTILACFLFKKEDVYKNISTLSMGEKCRVAFVKLYFSEANLLVLDEPTNYLDIQSREAIEDALLEFEGSILLVSHDRYTLQKLANKVATIKNGKVSSYPYSYKEWELLKNDIIQSSEVSNERKLLEMERSVLIMKDSFASVEEEKSHMEKIKSVQEKIRRLNKLTE